MKNAPFCVVIFALTVFFGANAGFGWNDEGHKLTGYIAWQRMTPQTRAAVIKILRGAPEDSNIAVFYKSFGIEPIEVRELQFFMMMPTWADMVRDRSFPVRYQKYHHSDWHYDDTFWKQVDGKVEYLTGFPEGGQALTKLEQFEMVLRDTNARDAEKAIALVWFLHLTGDIHQPLHNSARVTDREPKGDQGGNLFLLTPTGTPRENQYNLHSFWDGIANRSVPLKPVQCLDDYLSELGSSIIKKHPFDKNSDLKIGQYRKWHEEGMKLVTTVVFPPDLKRFEMPSEKYQRTAFETAERQLAFAGYRIAESLNGIFGSAPSTIVAPN